MTAKETIRERQENELQVLQSIFGNDVQDLRDNVPNSKPLDIKIALTPQKGSSGIQQAYTKISLHIVCSSKYPKTVPKIYLEESIGLSDLQIEELTKELELQASNLKGEVMIFELAQTVQTFLHKHNKPPAGSFYDEMLIQKMKRDEDFRKSQLVKENQERQVLRDEVLRRKEILRNESKSRKDTRRSISESSPTHRKTSSSDSSESSSSYFKAHECAEHRNSDAMYFSDVRRKIQKGSCIGHSQKGCVAFSGIDLDTGQLLYITEWNIKYSQLELKCNGQSVDDIITNIEKQVISLSHLRHKNLITYECVLCMKKKDSVVIYLVQEFVFGISICNISISLGWCADGASLVAKGVLDALTFLHNKGVSHGLLYDTTVFLDNSGTIKLMDFALVPYLQELVGEKLNKVGDLPALGALIESLSPTPHSEMRDFILKCKSERTLSASNLLDHPFLRPVLFNEIVRAETNIPNMISDRPVMQLSHVNTHINSGRSRVQTEFEVLHYLGKGAYGDVLKVRNILDNREYAIKRIPLSARNRLLYKKMTREVELLSRLNHENVVRYYNSWIETATINDDKTKVNLEAGDWSVSHESRKHSNHVPKILDESEESSTSDWINCIRNVDDSSSSDGIEFVNSNGKIISDEETDDDELSTEPSSLIRRPQPLIQYMYIQMEFCEKSTLRTAIDVGLYLDTERLWRLFREIAEGLSHIHQQGMIHRDLKPVNIFLDSRDQVKIGDFGLATTSCLALQSQEQNIALNQFEMGNSLTGKVGTALYVAPELTDNASKSTYNQKVDLYSLGIILFEMSYPPFETGMERIKILSSIRLPTINLPDKILNDQKYQQHARVIRWLLNHDPCNRPTAEELLASELVPPAKLEANELQEMLRHALANPQSKAYKHLISRCLAQQSDNVLELTYHMGLIPISSILEFVKNKIIMLFRKHGAIEVVTPLLTPYSKNCFIHNNSVRLMSQSGNVVFLPHELRIPFARHVALNGINSIRRYSVGRVYREKKVFNFHPKQLYECAFDIITPNPGNLLVDAELLSIAYEITNELPILRTKNISIRINHTSLLRAILLYCNVPTQKYNELFTTVINFADGKISKFQFQSTINAIMERSKQSSTNNLMDLLQTEYLLGGPRGVISGSTLKTLIRGRGEAAALAKGAIRELESVVTLAQALGVSCPINLLAGLPIGYDRAKTGGIVWQMLAEKKPERNSVTYILAAGGRYDGILADFQKTAHTSGFTIPDREMSGAGFSFALDKLILLLGPNLIGQCSSVDVVVCVTGSRPPLQDVTQVLRSLWASGIRSGVVESTNQDEAQDMAKELGAAHIILLGEGGMLRVRSWERDRFQERHVTRPELIDSIQKLLKPEQIPNEHLCLANTTFKNNYSAINLPTVHVILLGNENKINTNMRKRYETLLKQQMSNTFLLFEKKERITVIGIELHGPILFALTGAFDPRDCASKTTDDEIKHVTERYPKYKKYILEICDEVIDLLSERRHPSIICLYSISDYSYRIIL